MPARKAVWAYADRRNPLLPRETKRWRDLYRGRAAVEREFGRLKNANKGMPIWSWIIIGVAAAGAIVFVVSKTRVVSRRRLERRRAQARVLREEAEDRARRAEEREALARDIAGQAHEEREHAQKLERRAGKLDPRTARHSSRQEGKAEQRPARRAS